MKQNPQEVATDLIKRAALNLTLHPQALKVWPVQAGRSWMIHIQPQGADVPRILGKKGIHFKALRTLAAAVGNKGGVVMSLSLIEEEGENRTVDRYGKFQPSASWNSSEVMKLLSDICDNVFHNPVKIDLIDTTAKTSAIEIAVSSREPKALVDPMRMALQVLFNAIGKANGRELLLDIVVEGEHGGQVDLAAIMSGG